jgi:hypothetical protein
MQRADAALTSCRIFKARSRSHGLVGWETRIRTWIDGVRDRGPAVGRPPRAWNFLHVPILCSSFMLVLHDHARSPRAPLPFAGRCRAAELWRKWRLV